MKQYADQQFKKVTRGMQEKAQSVSARYKEEKETRKIKDVREMFVDENEQDIAVIGGGYLSNMLHTGTLSKGFGVLTERRLYYKGKCYYKSGKNYLKTDEERIVDVQDVTSSGFVYTRNFLWLFLTIIFCWTIILPIIFLLVFIFYKRAMYEISFAGGAIAIKVSAYGVSEIKAFDKELRMAKDSYIERRCR